MGDGRPARVAPALFQPASQTVVAPRAFSLPGWTREAEVRISTLESTAALRPDPPPLAKEAFQMSHKRFFKETVAPSSETEAARRLRLCIHPRK